VQSKYDVQYLTYWWRYGANTAFCLVEAPSKEAAETVHREAHGQVATNIIEVDQRSLEAFLGRVVLPPEDEIREDTAFRVILCVSAEERLPFDSGRIDKEVKNRGATTVSREPGELLACFAVPEAALRCALAIQGSYLPMSSFYDGRTISPRIGVSGGEPVLTHLGLFGDVIEEARQLSRAAAPGDILVGPEVRALCGSSEYQWAAAALGSHLKGHNPGQSSGQQRAMPDGLSSREMDVLERIARGDTNAEIATGLYISRNTVATHVRHILAKTGSGNRAEATFYAVRHGLL
jgi:DNA-binding CsgD family transcriptional regulator